MSEKDFIAGLHNNSRASSNFSLPHISSLLLRSLANHHQLHPSRAQQLCLEQGILPDIYLRNHPTYDLKQQLNLARSAVFLTGLGGLGGYVLEILARTGVGTIIMADGDLFEESNLNRQILGTWNNLGQAKAEAAEQRLHLINPFCTAKILDCFVQRRDLPDLISRADLVADALGGIEFRPVLLKESGLANRPLVTGFVAGSTGLVSTVYPGGKAPSQFWQGRSSGAAENILGNAAPIVSLTASMQAAEIISILSGQGPRLKDMVFLADLDSLTFDLLKL
ncbi:MAG: HesA/MoeB/ThiF family protein [Desulfonatronovibrionaceae bacterium]